MGRSWPWTGRDEELEFVDAALRRADGPGGVVLAGAPGVGKTRLAREALAAAEQRGARVLWVTATVSAQGLPLGAFAATTGELTGDPAQLLSQAAEALLADTGGRGVVVGIDDAHLLDDLSALLVQHLVQRRLATVLITTRTGEPAPDAVTALWKDGLLDRVDVQPLSEQETAALLEAVLAGPVDSASVARLMALSCGNALYLRQLVEGELETGGLSEVRGVWRWDGNPRVSPSLTELVEARMGRLSDPVRDVVDLLAVGEPLGIALLTELTDPSAVEQAEEAGLVTVEPEGRRLQVRLAHPLYGETRRAAMGLVRTRRIRGQIVSALEATGARRAGDTLRRAVLSLGSDRELDPQLLTTAAQAAIALLDVPLAGRLAKAAVDAGGGFDAGLTLAMTWSWLGLGEEADRQLATLDPPGGPEALMLTLVRAANLFFSCRSPERGAAVLDAGLGAVDDPAARCALLAVRAIFHTYTGPPAAALSTADEALTSSQLPDQPLFMAHWARVGALGMSGRVHEMRDAADRAYAVAAHSFDAVVPSWGLCEMQMCGLRLAGYVPAAEEAARAWHARCVDIPGPLPLLGVGLLGYAALYRGQLQTAIRLVREAEAGLGTAREQGPGLRNLITLTQAHAMAGEVEDARRAHDELVADWFEAWPVYQPEVILAGAWVAAAEGAVSEAIQQAREATDLAAGRGQIAHEALALHTAVCFGDRTVADRLAELATRVDGPRAGAAAAQAAALAADDGAALLAASEHLEEMGDLLAAADAAAQAAVALDRKGQRGPGHAATARAERLARVCEGARTPALIAAAKPLPLTDREREIATLAAQGLSNREIADRLVVSIRTVEGHVYRACIKLGVRDRTELAAVISPLAR